MNHNETTNESARTHKPFKPTELVGYQETAVVSREILRGAGGSVTVFAFDAGEGLSEHTAPFDALVYVVEGKVQISIAGRVNELGPGDMLVMPAHQPHAVRAITKLKMLLVMLRS